VIRSLPCGLAPVLIVALVSLASAASAADGTTTPPMLRGDLELGYRGGLAVVQLEDRSSDDDNYAEVASFTEQNHAMLIRGSFAPYHGIAVSLEVPITFHRQLQWITGRGYHYDPATGRPTMAGATSLDEATLDASPASLRRHGFGDISLGFRIVPFAQRGLPDREAPMDLAFDIGFRFPSGQHPHKLRDDGTSYPGQGGGGVTVGATAARTVGSTEPYLSIHYSHNAPFSTSEAGSDGSDDSDADSAGLAADEHKAADRFRLRAGAVISAYLDPETGRAVHLDLSMTATYVGPEYRFSGLRLPTTLSDTVGQKSVLSEHVQITGGLGVAISPRPEVDITIDFDTTWSSPHTVERVSNNAYSVRTRGDSLALHWGVGVRLHFR
jgi:hypothetical protein